MLSITKQTIDMLELLPEKEQLLANEIIKRIVISWDSDFTKFTRAEYENLEKAEKEILNGEVVSHNEINWD